jgi:hypothetical protein
VFGAMDSIGRCTVGESTLSMTDAANSAHGEVQRQETERQKRQTNIYPYLPGQVHFVDPFLSDLAVELRFSLSD